MRTKSMAVLQAAKNVIMGNIRSEERVLHDVEKCIQTHIHKRDTVRLKIETYRQEIADIDSALRKLEGYHD